MTATLTEPRFRALLSEVEAIGGDYASGYGRGLRRLYHGERFCTEEEHARWQALDPDDEDRSRADRARGYRDGYAGRRPTWPCEVEGCRERAAVGGLCRGHYAQRQRGQPLRPLRGAHGQLGDEPLVSMRLRVPEPVRDAAQADPGGARKALEGWSQRRAR